MHRQGLLTISGLTAHGQKSQNAVETSQSRNYNKELTLLCNPSLRKNAKPFISEDRDFTVTVACFAAL
jgi:hypothetical protein